MSSMRSATGRIKDPRSVTDRAFKEREIRQLVEVSYSTKLSSFNYLSPASTWEMTADI